MKNKKAWLRIVEAFIAILIVASVLLVSITSIPRDDKSEEIHKMQRAILRQVSLNDSLREEILYGNKENTEKFIQEIKPAYWNFTTEICEVNAICGISSYPAGKEVYVDEILISASLESGLPEITPKKLKLFVWEK